MDLLQHLDDDSIAAILLGIGTWKLVFYTAAISFKSRFQDVPHFAGFFPLCPAILHGITGLLIALSGLLTILRTQNSKFKHILMLLGGAMICHAITLLSITTLDLLDIRKLPVPVAFPGSDDDLIAMVNSVGRVSLSFNWLEFIFVWIIIIYFVKKLYYKYV